MGEPRKIRRGNRFAPVCGWAMALLLVAVGANCGQAQDRASQQTRKQAQPAKAVVLDSVVAVVNRQPILASDVDNEMRLAVLNPAQGGSGSLTPGRALQQLISRTLIQEQIREEDAQAIEPTQAEVGARLEEIRRELPACVHFHCSSSQGWKAFLAAHGLTQEEVESYLSSRILILRFIELRFRQGIRITPDQIKTYYTKTLLPQYAAGEAIPPLDQVAPRIQEILLEQQVNVLFDRWLDELRKQGDVEMLDPALEPPANNAPALFAPELKSTKTLPGAGKGGA